MKALLRTLGIFTAALLSSGTAWAQSAPPPVFPMTVTSSITPTAASATAAIQFRPQDIGASGGVFAFAVAPASIVKAGDLPQAMKVGLAREESKADPPACVLAQLTASGELTAVLPTQLRPSAVGALTSAGTTLTILNGTATASIAGATFYAGYGTNGTAMLNAGTFRSAITVPGAGICPMPSSQTALWWNPAEPGWGINLNHQGNVVFGTLFTYDANRAPLWLVMSNGTVEADGVTFTGDLYQTKGPAFNANPFRPIGANDVTKVGTMSVSFQDVNSGTLRYTVNGASVAKGIQRQVFGARAAPCFPSTASRTTAHNYQDLWWNPAESGWGLNLAHQDDTIFATLFTYDAAGKPLWLVMSAGTWRGDFYQGELYRTSGPPFDASSFAAATATPVGSMRLSFTDGSNGTLTYNYFGASVTKRITRQVFSGKVPDCRDLEDPVTLRVPAGDGASTLATLDWTNVSGAGAPWEYPAGPVGAGTLRIAPGLLKRWVLPVPVKTNGEPRAIAALDEIERQLGKTIFDRTSLANTPNELITRGVFVTVGTATPVIGESEQVTCAHTMYWGKPATETGVMKLRMELRIDGRVCKASRDRVIHEFGHVLGMGRHYSGFEEGDQEISPLFWNALATMYANAPGTPGPDIVVP